MKKFMCVTLLGLFMVTQIQASYGNCTNPPTSDYDLAKALFNHTSTWTLVWEYTSGWNRAEGFVTNYLTDTVEYMKTHGTLTNIMTRLLNEGYVCGMIEHKWELGSGESTVYVVYPKQRHCVLCGKIETEEAK